MSQGTQKCPVLQLPIWKTGTVPTACAAGFLGVTQAPGTQQHLVKVSYFVSLVFTWLSWHLCHNREIWGHLPQIFIRRIN